jgi:hypothetical protein
MQFTPTIVGLAVAILILVNVTAVLRAHFRHRRVRAALDLPQRMGTTKGNVQVERAMEMFADTDAKLRQRAPHLSQEERHAMAKALLHAKGILPPAKSIRR